eukprot:15376-Heterococcus_DN1.PRE.3
MSALCATSTRFTVYNAKYSRSAHSKLAVYRPTHAADHATMNALIDAQNLCTSCCGLAHAAVRIGEPDRANAIAYTNIAMPNIY